jgi:hypothetical protein
MTDATVVAAAAEHRNITQAVVAAGVAVMQQRSHIRLKKNSK